MKLSPTEIYQGRKIFLIGSTGFLGKVTLSMLLHRFPAVGKVYVTVRARSLEESRTRFWNNVITAPPFDPLRERYGSAFEGFIKDKVEILGGDIGDNNLGYTEEEADEAAGAHPRLDLLRRGQPLRPRLGERSRDRLLPAQGGVARRRVPRRAG